MFRIKRHIIRLLLLTTIGYVCLANVKAQPAGGEAIDQAVKRRTLKPSVLSQSPKKLSFFSLLNYLADTCNVTLIAEDVPLRREITESAGEAALPSLCGSKTFPFEEARDLFSLFDYDLLRYQEGVYLLKKRYTDPLDFPCVSLPEWAAAIQDVQRLMEPFSPGVHDRFTEDERIRGLFQSFMPEQRKALPERGVPVLALDERNRRRLHVFLDYFAVESKFDTISLIAMQSRCVLDRRTQFGWFLRKEMPQKGKIFGYEGPMPLAGENAAEAASLRFRPLSHIPPFIDRLDGRLMATVSVSGIPDAPSDEDRESPKMDAALHPNYVTLGEVVNRLNAALSQKTAVSVARPKDKERRFDIAPALSEKRVTIAGLQRAVPETLFYALGKIYGLRVKDDPQRHVYSLERPRVPTVTDRSGLNRAIESALPAAFTAQVHLSMIKAMQVMTEEAKRKARSFLVPEGKYLGNMRFHAAARRLEGLLKERVGDSKSIPAPQLNAEERFAVCHSLMANAEDILIGMLCAPEPPYIADFDGLILKGGDGQLPDGTKTFSLSAGFVHKNGVFQGWMGLTLPAKDLGIPPLP